MVNETRQDLLGVDNLQIRVSKVAVKIMVQASGSLNFELRMERHYHVHVCLFHGTELWVLVKVSHHARIIARAE